LLKYQVDLIMKTKTLLSVTKITRFNKDGKLSMLMSIQLNQLKENSIRNSVSMLREISTLYLQWIHTDILILSTTETWSSKLQMEERLKSGTSIRNHWPSRQD
jgi:hypothetical protein